MKIFRFTLLSVVLSCSCTLFYSCTEDSSLDEIGKPVPDNWGAQDPRYEELTETLTSLTHKTILNSGNFNPETGASYLKQIRKWLYVINADAQGGLLEGDVVASVVTSCMAAQSVASLSHNLEGPELMSLERSLDQQLLADTSWVKTPLDNAGYIHNIVLVNLYKNYGEDLLTIPTYQIYSETNYLVTKYLGASFVNPEAERNAEQLHEQMLEVYNSSETINDFYVEWKALNLNMRNQLNILEIVMHGFSQIDLNADNGRYLNAVMQTINASALSQNEKQSLRTGISIGHASAILWSRQFFSSKHVEAANVVDNALE